MEEILASNDATTSNEDLLASLTAWNRTKWAQIRNSMFNKGINRISLQAIESSAFVVSLDDEAYETDIYKGADLSLFGKAMLHGNGHNRWFDKSFTLCIGTNGRLLLRVPLNFLYSVDVDFTIFKIFLKAYFSFEAIFSNNFGLFSRK